MVAEINLDYLAGFVDGEGCISLVKRKARKQGYSPEYKPVMIIANTYKELIDKLQSVFGGAIYPQRNRNPIWKARYQLCWNNYEVYKLCRLLSKKLIMKKEQAEIIVAFYDNRPEKKNYPLPANELERRQKLYERIRVLNKRGLK
jgi:hypothetical protein